MDSDKWDGRTRNGDIWDGDISNEMVTLHHRLTFIIDEQIKPLSLSD